MCGAAIFGVSDQSFVVAPNRRNRTTRRRKSAIKRARNPLTLLRLNLKHADVVVLRRRQRII